MKKVLTTIIVCFLIGFVSCKSAINSDTEERKSTSITLNFLDEYVYPSKLVYNDYLIGGLSGIDYYNNVFYLVSDDESNPRIYKADIHISDKKIDTVIFTKSISLKDSISNFLKHNVLDLESIRLDNQGNFIVSSEGDIDKFKNPSIITFDSLGNFMSNFSIPSKYTIPDNRNARPRHNGVFEGLTNSFDGKGIWSAIEFPLIPDGLMPSYRLTDSPVRLTYYDLQTKKATKEYVYKLSPLVRPKKGVFNLNGLTEILEYKKDHFFIIERTYQNGYINDENLIKIYTARLTENTTNVIGNQNLKEISCVPLEKELVFDFKTIKSRLTDQKIDNIEGITFGPTLANGNKTLLVVSDDNFQRFGKQLNQFVLFEIINH